MAEKKKPAKANKKRVLREEELRPPKRVSGGRGGGGREVSSAKIHAGRGEVKEQGTKRGAGSSREAKHRIGDGSSTRPTRPESRQMAQGRTERDGGTDTDPDRSGKYVYCIIQSTRPLSFGAIGIGSELMDVYTIGYQDIAAVVSDTPLEVYDPTRENVLAHEG